MIALVRIYHQKLNIVHRQLSLSSFGINLQTGTLIL